MIRKPVVEFFYDVASPYAFFAFEYISAAHKKFESKFDLEYKPIYFAPIVKHFKMVR